MAIRSGWTTRSPCTCCSAGVVAATAGAAAATGKVAVEAVGMVTVGAAASMAAAMAEAPRAVEVMLCSATSLWFVPPYASPGEILPAYFHPSLRMLFQHSRRVCCNVQDVVPKAIRSIIHHNWNEHSSELKLVWQPFLSFLSGAARPGYELQGY